MIGKSLVQKALLLGVLLAPGLAPGAEAELLDAVIRYVNGDVVTLGDLRVRVVDMERQIRDRGQRPPNTTRFRNYLLARALREATEELLLEQEAIRLEAPVDMRMIKRDILRESDRFPTLQAQREELDRRRRQLRILAVERFFYSRLPAIGPEELADSYQAQIEEFRRPARAKVWRIVLRPVGPGALQRLRDQLMTLVFRRLNDAPAAMREALPAGLRERFFAAEGDRAKLQILAEALRAALAAAPAEPDPATAALLEQLNTALEQSRGLHGEEEARAQLQAIREQVLAQPAGPLRLAAFQEAAREHHRIAAEAEAGGLYRHGERELVEPGDLSAGFDEAVFQLEAFGVSEILQVGDLLALVMVSERRPPQEKSLEEVGAQLRTMLEHEQREEARKLLVAQLWEKAVIIDTGELDVDRLLREAGAYQQEAGEDLGVEGPIKPPLSDDDVEQALPEPERGREAVERQDEPPPVLDDRP